MLTGSFKNELDLFSNSERIDIVVVSLRGLDRADWEEYPWRGEGGWKRDKRNAGTHVPERKRKIILHRKHITD